MIELEARDPSPGHRERRLYRLSVLTTTGRWARGLVGAAVLAALLAGTAWGNDEHFPFGPFRMYSTTTRLTGRVTSPKLDVTTATGKQLRLTTRDFGLRPAEMLGQIDRFIDDPDLLRLLADAYERSHPDADPLAEIRLVYVVNRLEGGRPVSAHTELLATWRRV